MDKPPLTSFTLAVEFGHPDPIHTIRLRVSGLVDRAYSHVANADILCTHLSWDVFYHNLELGMPTSRLDLTQCKFFGHQSAPGRLAIRNNQTFYNAIGVLYANAGPHPPHVLTIRVSHLPPAFHSSLNPAVAATLERLSLEPERDPKNMLEKPVDEVVEGKKGTQAQGDGSKQDESVVTSSQAQGDENWLDIEGSGRKQDEPAVSSTPAPGDEKMQDDPIVTSTQEPVQQSISAAGDESMQDDLTVDSNPAPSIQDNPAVASTREPAPQSTSAAGDKSMQDDPAVDSTAAPGDEKMQDDPIVTSTQEPVQQSISAAGGESMQDDLPVDSTREPAPQSISAAGDKSMQDDLAVNSTAAPGDEKMQDDPIVTSTQDPTRSRISDDVEEVEIPQEDPADEDQTAADRDYILLSSGSDDDSRPARDADDGYSPARSTSSHEDADDTPAPKQKSKPTPVVPEPDELEVQQDSMFTSIREEETEPKPGEGEDDKTKAFQERLAAYREQLAENEIARYLLPSDKPRLC